MFLKVRNFGNTLVKNVIFFWVCSKFNLDFKNLEQNSENFFGFETIAYEYDILNIPIKNRGLLIGSQCVKKQS